MTNKRVRLRPIRDEDSELLYEWINDRELLINNAPYRPTAETDHRNWFQNITKRSDLVLFVIEDLEAARAIGSCQLLNINWVHRSADLQVRIGDPESQNKGLGSEAIAQLIEFGFADLNLHRIALLVFATNVRAIRAYEKNGFVLEGRFREAVYVDGKRVDVLCMGRLRTDRA